MGPPAAHNAEGKTMHHTPTAAICFSLFLAAPLASAQKPDCSIRPARGTGQAELRSLAKISSKDAEARAVLSVAPNKVNAIMSSEVEVVRSEERRVGKE